MTMLRRLFFVVLGVSFLLPALAEKDPMKYGKVSKEELEMTVYPADSSASAVILCNYGYFDARQLQFVHVKRIKILKEEGKGFASFSVPAAEKTNVRGQVVNLENGVPVVTKLSKSGIYIENVVGDVYRARVAMPNVKVGSVIDVEFYYTGLPSYWEFQSRIPVKWSELVLEPTIYFTLQKNFVGYVPLSIASEDRWVAKDVPAFHPEPYIDNPENYMTRFNIEISAVSIPGTYYKNYSTSWENVAKSLRESDDFGRRLSDYFNMYLNDMKKEVQATAKTPVEQMKKAFELIKTIKWDKTSTIWVSNDGLSSVFKKKYGNSAEINLNLIILLRKLDINANPIVLSTRDNGLLPPFTASRDKLNYVVAQAEIDGQTYILDATEEFLPVNMLPERAINGRGLLITKQGYSFSEFAPQQKERVINLLNLKLSADGKISGDWKSVNYDYAAFLKKNERKTFNSEEEYLKSVENDNVGLSVEDYHQKGIDSTDTNVEEAFNIVWKNKMTQIGDQLFLNPFLIDRTDENPFKLENRQYPVNFTTSKDYKYIINITIPDGYKVEQLPKSVKISMPENTASYQLQAMTNENVVQLSMKMNINKPVFLMTEYEMLRSFFDEIVKKEAETLILKKI